MSLTTLYTFIYLPKLYEHPVYPMPYLLFLFQISIFFSLICCFVKHGAFLEKKKKQPPPILSRADIIIVKISLLWF